MNLSEAFTIRRGEVATFVGGGGKMTAMIRLADEQLSLGGKVVITTTTKMFEPQTKFPHRLEVCEDQSHFVARVEEALKKTAAVVLAVGYTAEGKLKGIPPKAVRELLTLKEISAVLVKGDGAVDRPLKAPAVHEPVVAEGTSLMVPVAGIEAVGCPLDGKIAHRPELVSLVTGLKVGEPVTPMTVALLLTSEQGLIKSAPSHARVIPLINQVESESQLEAAMEISRAAFLNAPSLIGRIVIGHVKRRQPVVRVVDRT